MKEKAWIIKHLPQGREDVVGRDAELQKLDNYLKNYKTAKPVILSGGTGSGKTAMVLALAAEQDLEVIEVNASDTRNKAGILSVVGEALKQQSLFMRQRLVLIDEVDSVSGTKDRGAIPTLIKLVGEACHPIIFTANDANHDKLKPLRKVAQVIDLAPLEHTNIVARLTAIAKVEGAKVSGATIKGIARRSGGDLRAGINDLQTMASLDTDDLAVLGDRDVTGDIKDALMRVFKTTNAAVALPAYDNVPEDLDKIFLWLDENLPREYTKPEDLARAYDALAEADKFFGRIRRWQYYRFYVYCYNLLSAGVALAKDEKYKSPPDYKRSERPLKIWIARNANAKKKAIAAKIAEETHASTRRVLQEFPLYVAMARNKTILAGMQERFDLDGDEVAWLQRKTAV